MIKVLQLIHGLNMGGAESLVKDYALGINKKKFDVTVLCYDRLNSPYEALLLSKGIKVIYICDEMFFYRKPSLAAKIINKLQRYIISRRYIRRICPDIIHFHLPVSSYIRFAKPKRETRLFYTQHFDVDRWKEVYPKEISNMKYLIKRYHLRMIALNSDMKQEIDELFGVDHTIVLNNGVDQKRYANAKSKEQIRKELGLSDDAFVVGHVGRFDKIKNHTFLLDVFQRVSICNAKARLLMVGKGDMRVEIEKKAQKMSILDKLMILEDRMDIPDLMKAMDVFVFPSLSEGLAIVCIEAQLAGLRCIVADTVPSATKISNLIQYVSLQKSAEYWADQIITSQIHNVEYYGAEQWDIKNIIHQLENVYIKAFSV